MEACTIRLARPDELDEMVAIDDDTGQLYAEAGVPIELSATASFVVDEQARWLEAARAGRAFFAIDARSEPAGFAVVSLLDAAPYLEQLSVRMRAMRRGIGTQLLRHAIDWAADQGGDGLWLTTYGHLPWNRPFYERVGFVVVPESACGPGVRHHLEEQRRWLPDPEQRVAMRRPHASP